jgi:hypothetical protein
MFSDDFETIDDFYIDRHPKDDQFDYNKLSHKEKNTFDKKSDLYGKLQIEKMKIESKWSKGKLSNSSYMKIMSKINNAENELIKKDNTNYFSKKLKNNYAIKNKNFRNGKKCLKK